MAGSNLGGPSQAEPTVRDTTSWHFTVDRAVAAAGHGEHGGWQDARTGNVHCRCGALLFPLEQVLSEAKVAA
jgi:hypothetical protein